MVAWERWIGIEVGNRYSIKEFSSAEENQAWFLASSPESPHEEIVVTFLPAERDNAGWPDYLRDLSHPHLRRILGAWEESILGRKWRCIAMERSGAPLSDLLTRDGPLPITRARELTAHLIGALRYLHAKNLVYRNLRPESIAEAGGAWKLADFALLCPAGQVNPKQTRSFLAISPQAPPDAFDGLVSPAWDVYSLGVTLSQCLMGDDSGRGARLRLPDPFEMIVTGCLKPAPESRVSLDDIAQMLGLNRIPIAEPRRDEPVRESPAVPRREISLPAPRPRYTDEPARKWNWRWLGVACILFMCDALLLFFINAQRRRPVPVAAPAPPAEAAPAPKPVSAPVAEVDPASAKRQIGAFLQHWTATLQNRDVEGQIDCYAPRVAPFFGASSADPQQVRREKQRVFARIGKVHKMTIGNLVYESLDGDRAVVSFSKEWDIAGANPSSGVEDEKLTLQRIDGKWKIAGEEETHIRWVKR
jgi:ketosteroid isomerase-like protein